MFTVQNPTCPPGKLCVAKSTMVLELQTAILSVIEDHGMKDLIPKMVFLASDGALVDSRNNSGIIRLLQEDSPWVSFIWCFSHRLELALKDSLKDFIDPADESLCNLCYMYKESSKKV